MRHPSLAAFLRGAVAPLLLASACTPRDEPLAPGAAHQAVARVRVTPGDTALGAGATVALEADAEDSDGRDVRAERPRWSSSDTSVIAVSAEGVATARGAGWATVRAEVGGVVGRSVVSVRGGDPTTAVLVLAGDIAACDRRGDEATAALVASRLAAGGATVAPLGDLAYPSGTSTQFRDCYGPSWGAFRDRSRPAVGNHDYATANARAYWDYFGPAAGARGEGWYGYDLGAWHVVVLNSNCDRVACGRGSAQERWLRADLAAHADRCTLAYWHHPRWNSGETHGDDARLGAFWEALYEHGVELVVNAHDHVYERFAPQTPAGRLDAARGVRQFTVGTGGKSLGRLGRRKANSERFDAGAPGVLTLTLGDGTYAWEHAAVGGAVVDAGTGRCR